MWQWGCPSDVQGDKCDDGHREGVGGGGERRQRQKQRKKIDKKRKKKIGQI